MRHFYQSSIDKSLNLLPVSKGGFGTDNLEDAADVLDALRYRDLNRPGGAAILGENGEFPSHLLPLGYLPDNFVALYGPTSVPKLGTAIFKISNYDEKTSYTITTENGKAYQFGDQIAFAAGGVVGASSISINGSVYVIQITSTSPTMPTIIAPLQDSSNHEASVSFMSSSFASPQIPDQHASTDWQLALDSDFLNVVKQTLVDTVNTTSWTVTDLSPNTQYYVRVRHTSLSTGPSPWSPTLRIATRAFQVVQPTTVTQPANGALNIDTRPTLTTAAYVSGGGTDFHTSTDWEIASDVSFNTVVWSSYADPVNKTTVKAVSLPYNALYYARARHISSVTGAGPWSPVVSFRTLSSPLVSTPSITTPASDGLQVEQGAAITSSPFGVSAGYATHTVTVYEIATDAGFTNIVATTTSNTPITSWIPTGLTIGQEYYVRVKYKANAVQ